MNEVCRYVFMILLAGVSFTAFSVLLRTILLYVNPDLKGKITRSIQLRDVGTWIGLSEFILILMFVILGEYTAIAIVFGAKEIVRSDDIKKNASYYLLGTLLNIVFSILSSLVIIRLTQKIFGY